MAKKKADKKLRTRSHIIEALSVNHFEYFAYSNGFTVERFKADYGYDLDVYTYSDTGETENGSIYVQLKATDSIKFVKKGQYVSFALDKRDINHWTEEPMPCFFVVYDAHTQKAYWIYIQAYFKGVDLKKIGDSHNARIPVTNRINKRTLKKFRDYKIKVLDQLDGVIQHNA